MNILGKPVELSRFDAFRIKEEDYILFGEHVTHGGGAGWDNMLGLEMAAQEEELFSKIINDRLKTKALEGKAAMIVAVVYGSGGGTGSGAAPVVCKAVKDLRREDVRVVAFALLPSKEECRMRAYNSVTSLAFTSEMVTGLGTIPLEDYIKPGLPLREAYEEADENFARFFVLMAGAEELPQIKNDIKNKIIDLLER
jgi:cell division protein FtsZ